MIFLPGFCHFLNCSFLYFLGPLLLNVCILLKTIMPWRVEEVARALVEEVARALVEEVARALGASWQAGPLASRLDNI